MPASIFTSKHPHCSRLRLHSLALGLFAFLAAPPTFGAPSPAAPSDVGKVNHPEEEDFSETPFTEYGEFNEDKDEQEDSNFFAHGRFFGVSLGAGYETMGGNRGLLYQGGLPLIDFKLHYWFDFNFALDMGFSIAPHFFETSQERGGHVDVNLLRIGLNAKYYIDTKNLSAPISFANPFVTVGFGAYTQTKTAYAQGSTPDSDTGIGFCLGGGLEFAIRPKKTYFQFEGKYHMVNFNDTYSSLYQSANGIADLTGPIYTVQSNLLFTW